MHHPAKVLQVLAPNGKDLESGDSSVQVVVQMWDKNVFTFDVEESLENKVKKEDVVMVDYRSVSEHARLPRQTVTKILRGATAKRVWKVYSDFFTERGGQKQMVPPLPSLPGRK